MHRREFLAAAGFGATALSALAQTPQPAIAPFPAPRDWSGNTPLRYPDPDIIAVDNRFRRYSVNSQIKRLCNRDATPSE